MPDPPPKTLPLAVVSLALGAFSLAFVWIITAPAAIICGHIANRKIRHSGGGLRGREFALVGLILGYFSVIAETIRMVGLWL